MSDAPSAPRRYKIWFQGATDRSAHNAYISRLEPFLRRVVSPEFDLQFNTVTPPATTTHAITEFRMARAFIRNAVRAQREGFDVMAITHFQDAGLAECKAAVEIPVVGMGETTLLHACTLGRKMGLVTINPAFIPWHEDQVIRYGLAQRVVGVRAVNAKISDFMDAFERADAYDALRAKFDHEAHILLEAGADVIVPSGGLPMLLFGGEHAAQIDGAPILNGLAIVAQAAEAAVRLKELTGIAVSRRSNYAKAPEKSLNEFLEHG